MRKDDFKEDACALLGKRIRALREKKNFSQDKLAESANLSTKHLGDVERGTANVSIELLTRIANALNVRLSDIFNCDHELSIEDLRKEIVQDLPKLSYEETQITYRLLKSFLE